MKIVSFIVILGLGVSAFLYSRYGTERVAPAITPDQSTLVQAHSPMIGPADASVTIVEFFDPACEGCSAFHPIVKNILAEFPGEVRVVYRYVPFHKGSEEAVRILEAARKQNLFEPVLDALFARQSEWAAHGREDSAKAWDIAGAVGLALDQARIEAKSPETDRVVERDVADSRIFGIQQTPTFLVNETPLELFGPEGLRALVRSELAEKRLEQPQ